MSISIARTRTPGGPLELRPQTGHQDDFQAPFRAGTAAQRLELKTAGAEEQPQPDTDHEAEDTFDTSPGQLSAPPPQRDLGNSQVLRFSDLDTSDIGAAFTPSETGDGSDGSLFLLDSPLQGERNRQKPLQVSLSGATFFDAVRRNKKQEQLERFEAEKLEAQRKEEEKQE